MSGDMIRVIAYNAETERTGIAYVREDTMEFLEFMYSFIGCRTVEAVDVDSKTTAWVDEEGLFAGGPITRVSGWPQPLVGNIVITGPPDSEGNTTSAPAEGTVDFTKLGYLNDSI